MKATPPFTPKVKDAFDTSNFQRYEEPPDENYKDDGSHWDKDF